MRKKKTSVQAVDRKFVRHFEQTSHGAYKSALASGLAVVVASEGALWRVVKSGDQIERTKIKDLPPPVPVEKGAKFTIR